MGLRITAAILGALLVVAGAALVYVPAAVVIGGGMLLGWGLLSEADR